MRECNRYIIYIFPLIIFLLLGIECFSSSIKAKVFKKELIICSKQKEYSNSLPLVALIGKTESSTKGQLDGEMFLFMGGITGSMNQENNYILKYAIEDQYGAKILNEKIDNSSNIRIKEINSNQAKLTIINQPFWNWDTCSCEYPIKVRIFEVPIGTIKKEHDIDLTK